MAQIEYKVLQYPEGITQKTEKEWNQLGKDGWDLISFGPTALDVTGSVAITVAVNGLSRTEINI